MTKKTISTEEAKKKNLKPEWQPGGSKRQELLDKAVEYLKAPIMETQADRHHFCLNNLILSSLRLGACSLPLPSYNHWPRASASD